MSCPVIVSVDDVGVLNQFNGSAIAVFRSRGALRSTQNQRHSRESGNPTPSAALRGNVARRVPAFAGMTKTKVPRGASVRSEENTSELPSLMRIATAGLCLEKKKERK